MNTSIPGKLVIHIEATGGFDHLASIKAEIKAILDDAEDAGMLEHDTLYGLTFAEVQGGED